MSLFLNRSFAALLVVFAVLSHPPAMQGQALTFTTLAGPEGGSERMSELVHAECMRYDAGVASLQIRNLPNHVYEALAERARRQRRSLAQQAVEELTQIPEAERRLRRIEVIEHLRQGLRQKPRRKLSLSPARLVRQDRNR